MRSRFEPAGINIREMLHHTDISGTETHHRGQDGIHKTVVALRGDVVVDQREGLDRVGAEVSYCYHLPRTGTGPSRVTRRSRE